MRQAQKKQVESYVELLTKAHNAIKAALKARKWDGALELLTQCQEGAILAGNLIEDAQGEGGIGFGVWAFWAGKGVRGVGGIMGMKLIV